MNKEEIEELAFKDRKELANLNELDLLEIIEFLQLDRKQWINQYSTTHNDYIYLQQEKIKLENLLDTILTYHLFSDTCPLEFGFEKDSLQDKAQNVFYEDDGEYCETNCDECYKKCWIKFFKRIMELKGEDNV